ncbi:piRNA biogenesis protein EXD1 isoform X2 [Eurytemora carolleeae]|uniref:piRNA biogenesis protein EXD1 isoform X2 n=1 Tax=Eurytemora carolleeae TaxID=1294199 RepID=UPI000C758D11|nr:piRNA biogenesis protein EXD1 isoform X2 [Eurytemora carolleeae]|eukprot:XP_023336961.1 piRNA biogenesis protein EXD1-like isoform X2 [Eurytemora affinis]
MENSDIPIQNGGPGEHDKFITNGGDCRVGPVFDPRTKLDETSYESKVYYLPTLRTSSYLRCDCSVSEIRTKLWETLEKPPAISVPRKVYVIEALNEAFDSALKDIDLSPVIGVQLEGINISRSGTLKCVSVCTETAVYLFDIGKMKYSVFKYGLQYFLESQEKVKVFHDVRFASDLLHHQYEVNLMNVFDTAVADITFFTMSQAQGFLPRFIRTYQVLCREYLGIPETGLFYFKYRPETMERDQGRFWRNGFDKQTILALSRNCLYFLPLYKICKKAVMYHFNQGTQLFLSTVRELGNNDAKKLQTKPIEKISTPQELCALYPTWSKDKEEARNQGRTVEGDFIYQDRGKYYPRQLCE